MQGKEFIFKTFFMYFYRITPKLRGFLQNNDRTHSDSNSGFSQRNTTFSFQFEISFVLLRFRGCFCISDGVSSCLCGYCSVSFQCTAKFRK